MEWRGKRGSRNIEDRRGMGVSGAGGIGIVGMLAVLAFGYFFGIDISPVVNSMSQTQMSSGEQRELTAEEQQMGEFVSVILGETEDVFGNPQHPYTRQLIEAIPGSSLKAGHWMI